MFVIRICIVLIGYTLMFKTLSTEQADLAFWPVLKTFLLLNTLSLALLYFVPVYLMTSLVMSKEEAVKT